MSLGKVPGKMVEPLSTRADNYDNLDNPVSDNHQAPSHWKTAEQ